VKCTSKKISALILALLIMVSSLTACGKSDDQNGKDVWMPFSQYTASQRVTSGRSSIIEHTDFDNRIEGFSSDLVVFSGNVESKNFENDRATAALLVDIGNNKVIYSDNAFETRFPASITKLMTVYTATKYLTSDSIITVSQEALDSISDPTAVMLGISAGDTMTLDQALRLLLLSSYNDVAQAVGVQAGGSIDEFAALMNEEALKLGCTGTHFENASGLHAENHYTTVYDIYLILNAVVKDPYLLEIIQNKEYTTTIHKANGSEWEVSAKNTNQFFVGNYDAPSSIVIVGGKTGTTEEAGRCLAIMVRDTHSNPYIAIVVGAESRDDLYYEMTDLLNLCNITVN